MSRFVVGIDLGTTNCALAYADSREATADAPVAPTRPFPIPQVVAVNDVSERPILPSFLYLPAAKEFPAGGTDLPWKNAGERSRRHLCPRARREGAGTAGRVRQELAFAPRRRPPERDPALDRRGGCCEGVPGRRFLCLSDSPSRRLEPPDRRQDGRRQA